MDRVTLRTRLRVAGTAVGLIIACFSAPAAPVPRFGRHMLECPVAGFHMMGIVQAGRGSRQRSAVRPGHAIMHDPCRGRLRSLAWVINLAAAHAPPGVQAVVAIALDQPMGRSCPAQAHLSPPMAQTWGRRRWADLGPTRRQMSPDILRKWIHYRTE